MVQKKIDRIIKDRNDEKIIQNIGNKEEIVHYNKWFTDNIKNYMKNLKGKIGVLFEPYRKFKGMSIFFGLKKSYLEDKRLYFKDKIYVAKRIIAINILNTMRENLRQHVGEWMKEYPILAEELIKARDDIISIIDDYQNRFNPKLTPYIQIYNHHPNYNEKYFKKIDSVDQTYFLGLMFADGWYHIEHYKYGDYCRLGLALKTEDKKRIYSLVDVLGLNPEKIKTRLIESSYDNKDHSMTIIRWTSDSMAADLEALGMVYEINEKGRRIKSGLFPNFNRRELMLGLLLGFFDGDGNVYKKDGKIKVTIYNTNKQLLEQIKDYFNLQGKIGLGKTEVYDSETNRILLSKSYRLNIPINLYREMMLVRKDSMQRKREDPEKLKYYGLSLSRKWLMDNLHKQELENMLKFHSPYYIARSLGFTRDLIIWLAKDIFKLDIKSDGVSYYNTIYSSIQRDDINSEYYEEYHYWSKYLGELKKLREENTY